MTPLNLSHGYMVTHVVAAQLMDGCLIFSSTSDIPQGKIKNKLSFCIHIKQNFIGVADPGEGK